MYLWPFGFAAFTQLSTEAERQNVTGLGLMKYRYDSPQNLLVIRSPVLYNSKKKAQRRAKNAILYVQFITSSIGYTHTFFSRARYKILQRRKIYSVGR